MNKIVKQTLSLPFVLFFIGTGNVQAEKKSESRWYTQSQVEVGKVIYKKHCSSCHGKNAEATANWRQPLADDTYPAPPLNGTAHTWHHRLSALKKTISFGGIRWGGTMPGFKEYLSEKDQEAVIAFFQNKWSDEIYQAWLKRDGME